jgi:hypothetical protein
VAVSFIGGRSWSTQGRIFNNEMKSNNIPESDQVSGLVYLIKKRKKLAGRNCFMGARRV